MGLFVGLVNDSERQRTSRWRKGWDSNPRGSVNPLAVFKTAALNHSATLPRCVFNGLARQLTVEIGELAPDWHRTTSHFSSSTVTD
jgi:hypothetical protein